jgi:hypothetical protein
MNKPVLLQPGIFVFSDLIDAELTYLTDSLLAIRRAIFDLLMVSVFLRLAVRHAEIYENGVNILTSFETTAFVALLFIKKFS